MSDAMSMPTVPKTSRAPHDPAASGRRNRLVALVCAGVVAGMTGAAFAAVPLYDWFCRVTGYGGTTQVSTAAPLRVIDRTFEVRFDANINGNLPWRFRPEVDSVTVKAGEVATVHYTIENLSNEETAATAAYNVTPDIAGAYFSKIVCFCFTEQKLAANEKITVPVTFYVDPDVDQDRNLRSIRTITLSYTFFSAKPAKPIVGAVAVPTPERL